MSPPPASSDRDDAVEGALHERLRSLRFDPSEDPPGGDFAAQLHQRLVAAGAPDPARPWDRWVEALAARRWVPALVAAGLLLISAGLWMRAPAAPEIASAELPASKVAVVRVALHADVDVEAAEIQISLPEGLAFWSDGQELAERSFQWTQALTAGDNEIPIAVRGHSPGLYRVTVKARVGEQDLEHEVVLRVVRG